MVVFHPDSLLQKTDFCFIQAGVLDSEPTLAPALNLIDDLEKRPFFEEAVADVELDLPEDFEELEMIDLGGAGQLFEGIGQGRFEMYEWLDGNFVNLLEGGPKDIRKILCFELVDEAFVGVL